MTSARFETPVGSKRAPKARVAAACGMASESIGIHAERLAERHLAVGLVDRHPVEIRALRREILADLLVDLKLVGADRAERRRVEDEDGRLAGEVVTRERCAVLAAQRELGNVASCGKDAHLAQPELLDEGAVALEVVLLKVVQEPATAADEHEQPAAGVMVLLVGAKMLGELVDALGEQRDLDVGVPGVLVCCHRTG